MSDVFEIAKTRRDQIASEIASMEAEMARLDEFIDMAERLIAEKPLSDGKAVYVGKVGKLSANVFAKPAEEAATG